MIGASPTYIVFFRDERRVGSPLVPYEYSADTMAQLVTDMGEFDDAAEVWRFDPDVKPANVSPEVAEAWFEKRLRDYEPEEAASPEFIQEHLNDVARVIFTNQMSLRADRRHYRASGSPL